MPICAISVEVCVIRVPSHSSPATSPHHRSRHNGGWRCEPDWSANAWNTDDADGADKRGSTTCLFALSASKSASSAFHRIPRPQHPHTTDHGATAAEGVSRTGLQMHRTQMTLMEQTSADQRHSYLHHQRRSLRLQCSIAFLARNIPHTTRSMGRDSASSLPPAMGSQRNTSWSPGPVMPVKGSCTTGMAMGSATRKV